MKVQKRRPLFLVCTTLILLTIFRVDDAKADGGLYFTRNLADDGNTGDDASNGSMAYNSSGYPGTAKYFGGTDKALRYTYWNGSAWVYEDVVLTGNSYTGVHSSIAYDSSDKPHIAAWLQNTDGYRYVYLRRDGDQSLGDCSGSGSQHASWGCEVIATGPSSRHQAWTSIAIMPESPYTVAFAFPGTDKSLHYAYRVDCGKTNCCTDTSWTCEQVDAANYGPVPALAFDSSNEPQIAYVYTGGSSRTIMYARRNSGNSGCGGSEAANWECDSISSAPDYAVYPFYYPVDLVMKSTDDPVVIFYGDDVGEVSLCDSTDGGDTWDCSLLMYDAAKTHGWHAALTITNDDQVAATWHEHSGSTLWVAIPNLEGGDGNGTGCATDVTKWDCAQIGNADPEEATIAFFESASARHFGVSTYENNVNRNAYYHADAIDVVINEILYDPSGTELDNEWVELYVKRDGNLDRLVLTTNDLDSYDFPSLMVERGEFVVVHSGSGTNDTTGPQYVLYQGEASEVLHNIGDDVEVSRWNFTKSSNSRCHDWVAYGIEAGAKIDLKPNGCDWDGTFPSCGTCNTNPSSDTEGTSISLGPDGNEVDEVLYWEKSGDTGGLNTLGPTTYGATNMAAPTPARLAGLWTVPASRGMNITWSTLSEIETLATRPVRSTGAKWVPVGDWQMASPNSFAGQIMTAWDNSGLPSDHYAIEEIDNAGARRIIQTPLRQAEEPVVRAIVPFRRGLRRPGISGSNPTPVPSDTCRLSVERPGWVHISREALEESCPGPANWEELQLRHRGKPVPRRWSKNGLEFLAAAPASRYEANGIYELSAEKGGVPFVERNGAPWETGEDVTELVQTKRFEQEHIYHIGSPESDRFYWGFFGTGLPFEVALDSEGEVDRIRVHVVGVTDGVHGLELWLGNTRLGKKRFGGRMAKTMEFDLDGMQITSDTPLKLQAVGPGGMDYQYLAWVEMDVLETLQAGVDLEVPKDFTGNLAVWSPSEHVDAFEVAAVKGPTRLSGVETTTDSEGAWIRIGLNESPSNRIVRVVERNTSVDTELTPAVSMDPLKATDYLAIVDPKLQSGLAPLIAHRRFQGLKTAVVPMDAIRDQFGYGYADPLAIQRFLASLSSRGRLPRYLVLVGEATLDPLGHLGTGALNRVPTGFMTQRFYGYEMPSDDELIPQSLRDKIAVGRIPARSLEALNIYVDKLLDFEGHRSGRALLLNDESDPLLFNPINKEFYNEYLEPTHFHTQIKSVGEESLFSDLLTPYEGYDLDLLVYAGHGQLQGWGNHLVLEDLPDLPEVLWTLGVSIDCYDGHFANPYGESLAWEMLMLEEKGPLTAYAPGTIVAPGDHLKLGTALMDQLALQGASTVGDMVLQAEKNLRTKGGVHANMAASFNLLGDPATYWPGAPQSPIVQTPEADEPTDPTEDEIDIHTPKGCGCRSVGRSDPNLFQALWTLLD